MAGKMSSDQRPLTWQLESLGDLDNVDGGSENLGMDLGTVGRKAVVTSEHE